MISKDQIVTLVSSTPLAIEEISNYFKKDLSLSVSKTNSLSENALDLYVSSLSEEDKQVLRKYFFSKKIDICVQDNSARKKKILLRSRLCLLRLKKQHQRRQKRVFRVFIPKIL